MRVFLVFTLAMSGACLSNGLSLLPDTISLNSLLPCMDLIPKEFDTIPVFGGTKAIIATCHALLDKPTFLNTLITRFQGRFNATGGNPTTFAKHVCEYVEHNLKQRDGTVSWKKGCNQFTGMTDEELMHRHVELVPTAPGERPFEMEDRLLASTPASLDWRSNGGKNIVTPVKDQGQCGSCVTFSTTGIIEAAIAKAKGTMLDLSRQELLDCTTENGGCDGGWYVAALKQVQTYGLASDATYPYKAAQSPTCERSTRSARAVKSTDIVTQGSCSLSTTASNVTKEDNLKDSCAKYGPVAVAVAVHPDWYKYSSGIFDSGCADEINHAVHIVGYGPGYFIIKNSWGPNWGEKGYMRIKAGNGINKCNVADHCFFATSK